MVYKPIANAMVNTTNNWRFLNWVNIANCSQQRIHQTETRSLPPMSLGIAYGNMTGFMLATYQEHLDQVELSLFRLRKANFSRGKVCGSPLDVYNWLMYIAPGQSNRLRGYIIGSQIVQWDYSKHQSHVGIWVVNPQEANRAEAKLRQVKGDQTHWSRPHHRTPNYSSPILGRSNSWWQIQSRTIKWQANQRMGNQRRWHDLMANCCCNISHKSRNGRRSWIENGSSIEYGSRIYCGRRIDKEGVSGTVRGQRFGLSRRSQLVRVSLL